MKRNFDMIYKSKEIKAISQTVEQSNRPFFTERTLHLNGKHKMKYTTFNDAVSRVNLISLG